MIICGEKFKFELEVNEYGFTLWTKPLNGKYKRIWALDASTICEDGTFRIGKSNTEYPFAVKVSPEQFEWETNIEVYLVKKDG